MFTREAIMYCRIYSLYKFPMINFFRLTEALLRDFLNVVFFSQNFVTRTTLYFLRCNYVSVFLIKKYFKTYWDHMSNVSVFCLDVMLKLSINVNYELSLWIHCSIQWGIVLLPNLTETAFYYESLTCNFSVICSKRILTW